MSYNSEHEDDPSYNALGSQMSRNQLAEQWFAYRLWAAEPRGDFFEYPHTLSRNTSGSALRKELRL